ncbi:hypothetical protein GCM10010112_15360 [Actinoplanes lobatus]|uniref:Uncharacterized protein n=1 Tax=Actinoplanes lobatus TaxID=113568 RepID=A0A7W7HMM3_9ACTN|nr:hypothetical protein [Actinoplanes lobatus]MBB4753366.1 hypothetical protein [Actinoplanes lobatus]GGN59826.1 hypothetical protein GCM10010112_15360 [Actinoplanes lobatus]GIE37900.1 hypothetical protein Alo02nite_07980 [Actinoplanes lobatus]
MNMNLLRWAAAPLGLAVSAAVVLGFSGAAFTDTQTNAGNSFAVHDSVALQLTDKNSAVATLPLFDTATEHLNGKAANGVLKPGDTISNEITVNYTGKHDAVVALTATGATGTGKELADDLLVTVKNGAGDVVGAAEQKLSALSVPVLWDITGNPATPTQSQKYVFTVKLASGTTQYDATLGSVGFAFTATGK